jgi:hypothetical protein
VAYTKRKPHRHLPVHTFALAILNRTAISVSPAPNVTVQF